MGNQSAGGGWLWVVIRGGQGDLDTDQVIVSESQIWNCIETDTHEVEIVTVDVRDLFVLHQEREDPNLPLPLTTTITTTTTIIIASDLPMGEGTSLFPFCTVSVSCSTSF